MRKHIYLHTSNLDITKHLRDDHKFEIVPEYGIYEMQLSLRNEYGRIKTDQNYYHILLGAIQQEGCPWCASPSEIKKVRDSTEFSHAVYCMQCVGCGARGPLLNVSKSIEENEEAITHITQLLNDYFKTRRAWDADFVNPYETIK